MLATAFSWYFRYWQLLILLKIHMLATIFPDISDVGKPWKNILPDTSNVFEDEFEATCWSLFSLPIVLPPTLWKSFDNDDHDVGSDWGLLKSRCTLLDRCTQGHILRQSSICDYQIQILENMLKVSIFAAKNKSCPRKMKKSEERGGFEVLGKKLGHILTFRKSWQ